MMPHCNNQLRLADMGADPGVVREVRPKQSVRSVDQIEAFARPELRER